MEFLNSKSALAMQPRNNGVRSILRKYILEVPENFDFDFDFFLLK